MSPSESSESLAARVAFAAEPEKREFFAGRPRDFGVLPKVPLATFLVVERGTGVVALLFPETELAPTFFFRPVMCWVRAERVGG